MIRTATQLKAKVRNLSGSDSNKVIIQRCTNPAYQRSAAAPRADTDSQAYRD